MGAYMWFNSGGATMKDPRYTITHEFCGKATAQYILRFCGDYVAQSPTKKEAESLKAFHIKERDRILRGA